VIIILIQNRNSKILIILIENLFHNKI